MGKVLPLVPADKVLPLVPVGREPHLEPADMVLHLLPGEAHMVLHPVLAACRIHWELRWDTRLHNQVAVVEKLEMWPDDRNDLKMRIIAASRCNYWATRSSVRSHR